MKDTQPFSTNSEKFQKYPDQPNSEFEEYSKDEIEIVDTESKFIKTKYNGLQNNLVGEIYQHISVDLKGPFNIPGFHNERYLLAFIDSKASMQAELYFVQDKKPTNTAEKLEDYMQNVVIPNRKNLKIELQFSIMHSDNGNEFQSAYKKYASNLI
jgi:hypothetical protein